MNRQNHDYRDDFYLSSKRPNSKRRKHYNPDEIDRYNYVDRDIYSSSSDKRRKGKKRRKKCGLKKILTTALCLILITFLGVFAYGKYMLSRLNRSENIDTSKYIEQPADAPAWEVMSDKKINNILLIGTDKGDDGNSSRSDTSMLVSIDKENETVRLVSFLRDLYLEIPTVDYKTKFNVAYAKGGAALTMQTIENNFRVNVDKYISVDFESFEQIIDKLGGLDIKMDKKLCDEENKNMGSNLKPGVNHLNGKLTVYYTRIRNTDSDFGRTGRQREVIELIIQKIKKMNPVQINSMMNECFPLIKTNLTDSEFMYLASIAGTVSKYDIETMHIPNLNTYKEKRVKGIGAVLDLDLPKNCEMLREFLYGKNNKQ
jgi:LCP family protein required for cell wall assembly